MKAGGAEGCCTPAETISCMGFKTADVNQVLMVCNIAFHALMPLELCKADCCCLSKDLKYFQPEHYVMIRKGLLAYPLLRAWMLPPARYYDSLRERIGRNENIRLDDTDNVGWVQLPGVLDVPDQQDTTAQVQRQTLLIMHMREEANLQHSLMIWCSIRAVISQLWQKATAGKFQNRKQQHATNFRQWNKLRKWSQKDMCLYNTDPSRLEFWLTEYKQVMREPKEFQLCL